MKEALIAILVVATAGLTMAGASGYFAAGANERNITMTATSDVDLDVTIQANAIAQGVATHKE